MILALIISLAKEIADGREAEIVQQKGGRIGCHSAISSEGSEEVIISRDVDASPPRCGAMIEQTKSCHLQGRPRRYNR